MSNNIEGYRDISIYNGQLIPSGDPTITDYMVIKQPVPEKTFSETTEQKNREGRIDAINQAMLLGLVTTQIFVERLSNNDQWQKDIELAKQIDPNSRKEESSEVFPGLDAVSTMQITMRRLTKPNASEDELKRDVVEIYTTATDLLPKLKPITIFQNPKDEAERLSVIPAPIVIVEEQFPYVAELLEGAAHETANQLTPLEIAQNFIEAREKGKKINQAIIEQHLANIPEALQELLAINE